MLIGVMRCNDTSHAIMISQLNNFNSHCGCEFQRHISCNIKTISFNFFLPNL